MGGELAKTPAPAAKGGTAATAAAIGPSPLATHATSLRSPEDAAERDAHATASRLLAAGPPPWPSNARGGAGAPLPAGMRSWLAPRFGHDFGSVRIHTDAKAERSARALEARAYTHGNDVVFGAGAWSPSTTAGRHLLMHELAHVHQQRTLGGRARIQRDADLRVRGVQPRPETQGSGFGTRFFFEQDRSTYDESVAEEAAERRRLEEFANAHAGERFDVVGHASQEGPVDHNRALARARADTVAGILRSRGITVTSIRADIVSHERPIEYRLHRSVDVLPTGQPTCADVTGRAAIQAADRAACTNDFNRARGRANTILTEALRRLDATADADRDTTLGQRFPGHARSSIRTNVASIATLVSGVTPTCQTRCDPGCDRPAAGGGGTITICPPFYTPNYGGWNFDDHLRVFAVLHEGTHAANVGIDRAYSKSRLFIALTPAETLDNADSYSILVLTLAGAAGNAPAVLAARGAAPSDSYFGAAPGSPDTADGRDTRIRLGQAESWLNYTSFWIGNNSYQFIDGSLTAWHSADFGGVGHLLVEILAPTFRIGHPDRLDTFQPADRTTLTTWRGEIAGRGFSAAPVTARSSTGDRTRVAGVYDRLSRMLDGFGRSLTVVRAPTGDGSWSSASGLPGIGTQVALPDFTGVSAPAQVRHIIKLSARAVADPSLANAFVESCDAVHRIRGLEPAGSP